jgi:hypothetical protein
MEINCGGRDFVCVRVVKPGNVLFSSLRILKHHFNSSHSFYVSEVRNTEALNCITYTLDEHHELFILHFSRYLEKGGSMFHRNTDKYLPGCVILQCRRSVINLMWMLHIFCWSVILSKRILIDQDKKRKTQWITGFLDFLHRLVF